MNKQIAGTDLEGKSLEEIVLASWNGGKPTPVFNNAAQVMLLLQSYMPPCLSKPSAVLVCRLLQLVLAVLSRQCQVQKFLQRTICSPRNMTCPSLGPIILPCSLQSS